MEIKKQNDLWVVRFLQSFHGDGYRDRGWKNMTISGADGQGLRIIGESWQSQ
jgi:hypothetical protein